MNKIEMIKARQKSQMELNEQHEPVEERKREMLKGNIGKMKVQLVTGIFTRFTERLDLGLTFSKISAALTAKYREKTRTTCKFMAYADGNGIQHCNCHRTNFTFILRDR